VVNLVVLVLGCVLRAATKKNFEEEKCTFRENPS